MGWGFFTLLVFTCLWGLLTDLIWRLHSIRVHHFGVVMSLGWLIGVGLVLLGFYLGSG